MNDRDETNVERHLYGFSVIELMSEAAKDSAVMNSIAIREDSPLAAELIGAIRSGDLEALQRLLAEHPGLAQARIKDEKGGSKTPLHAASDWPGYFPNGPAVVKALIAAGADPDAPVEGSWHSETPLHWAASSDDVEVAEALIAGGANIEATGASIAGGTPLDDAVGYGCWRVARLLVERGARVEKLWHAAAMGMTSRVEEFFSGPSAPSPKEVNDAFWQACNGGHRRTAEYLFARGADLNWIPDYAKQTPLAIATGHDTGREALVGWLRGKGAKPENQPKRKRLRS
jgi:ankyrin repeat protein